jgi:cytoskeletal protein CcmA (bactofilin family)
MTDISRDNAGRSAEPNTLYIGQGVCVTGDISVPGIVVVDGIVEGNITGRAIWVSPSGTIKGKIAAVEAEIHGTISDSIEVKQLLIVHATGRVSGDVSYGELQLAKGAIISGTFSSVASRSEPKEPALEQVLGKAERPMIVHRIEPSRPVNGTGAHGKLPAADYRAAS